MRYRIIGIAVVFALGIGIGVSAAGRVPLLIWWLLSLCGLATAIVVVQRTSSRSVRAVLILVPVVAVGGLRGATVPSFSDALLRQAGSLTEVVGTVVSYPSGGADRITFTFRPDTLDADLRVTWAVDPRAIEPVLYGDRLKLSGQASLPEAFDGFDYPAYLARQGIVAQMYVENAAGATRLGVQKGNGLLRRGNAVRQWILDALSEQLAPEVAALASALLLGDRAALAEESEDAFRATGLMHVLAVSGLHLGIVLAGVWLILRRLHVRAAIAYPLVGCVVLAVLWIVGPRVSLLRAGLLFAFLALGNLLADLGLILKRTIRPLNGLAAAAIVLLAWRPGTLFESGFQLTIAATAAILVVVSAAYGVPRRIEAISTRAGAGRLPVRYVLTLGAVSLAAQVGTVPVTAWHFGSLHPWAVLANLVVVPLAVVSLWIGLLALLSAGLGWAAPLQGFGLALQELERLMVALSGLPAAEITVTKWVGPWLAGVFGFVGLIVLYRSRSS